MTTATRPTTVNATDADAAPSDDLTSGGHLTLAEYPSPTLPDRLRSATMTPATLDHPTATAPAPTAPAPTDDRTSARDWYAVSVAPRTAPDPRRVFTDLATWFAGPVPTDRTTVTAVLRDLATAADVDHLVPTADDADVVVQRLAGRILARYLDQPDHPALRRAAHRLGA